MTDRVTDRMPYSVEVDFRTASSFLVAYSVNLSRGGLFIETDADIPTGAAVTLDLQIPSAGLVPINGVVAWRRGTDSPEGCAGLGIEFQDVAPQLGTVIDGLVSSFHGVHILVLSGDRQDRTTLARSIKSIISTAEVMQAADANVATSLMSSDVDLAVIDIDFDVEGGLATLRAAKQQNPPVPTVALTLNNKLREHARAAGADEIATNPPSFAELQVVLVRALSKPAAVRDSSTPH
ncbi:MAG: TIGR02266 family protein [Deltaproteobacteria bacterium]|nr:TIGR02266 family protein [Deltaproteobacteria bacterium]MDQ3298468.1 TIGR02266 family protein [Myxococcota bacterium]